MLCFSDSDTVETWKNGKCNVYDIALSQGNAPFRIVKHTINDKDGYGTKIHTYVTRHLPEANVMTDILSVRFLYDPKFSVKTNGNQLDLSNHKGVVFSKEFSPTPNIHLMMTVIDSEKRQQNLNNME